MPTFSLATLGVEPRQTGLASALISAAQQLGGGVGAALLNRIATLSSSSSSTRDAPFAALVDGHRLAAVTGVGLLVAAALCAWQLAPPTPARRAA
jgi:hypothetical protein